MKMKRFSSYLVVLLVVLASFKAGIEYQRGDVSQDGQVDIADVSCLIDYLITGSWAVDTPPDTVPVAKTYDVNGVQFKMVPVKGGTFTMGPDDSGSTHEVTLDDYYIGQTEVGQDLWIAVMGENPSWHSSRNGFFEQLQRPVEYVSWERCQSFITALNSLTGLHFRMPTEAEWEFAARGGGMSKGYEYAGSNTIDEVAWYSENSSALGVGNPNYSTHVVGTKAANELGLYDMSGNVREWCQDWLGDYGTEAQANPTGPIVGTERVCRGGGWSSTASQCSVYYRNGSSPSTKSSRVGLRLAL